MTTTTEQLKGAGHNEEEVHANPDPGGVKIHVYLTGNENRPYFSLIFNGRSQADAFVERWAKARFAFIDDEYMPWHRVFRVTVEDA